MHTDDALDASWKVLSFKGLPFLCSHFLVPNNMIVLLDGKLWRVAGAVHDSVLLSVVEEDLEVEEGL